MTSLRSTRIRTLNELDDLEETWRSLERHENGPPVFQSWAWNRLWCDAVLAHTPSARLDVHLIHDDTGHVYGILPFFEQPLAGPALHVRQFLGHRMSYHNDVLLAEPGNADCALAVARSLENDLGARTILHLRHLPSDSPLSQALVSQGRTETQCTRILIDADPAVSAPADRLNAATRRTHRKRHRQLTQEYGCEFRVNTGSELEQAFDVFVELHRKRFESMDRATLLAERTLDFLRAVVLAEHEEARFETVELHSSGKAIASILAVRSRDRYFNINTGFNPEFSRYAPMRILLNESMRRAFDELSCGVYDFGPGYESYKFSWNPRVDENLFCVGSTNLYTKFAAVAYRRLFRRSLPNSSPPG